MTDVLILGLTAACFAVCVAYVALCDRIIGPDPVRTESPGRAAVPEHGEVDR